PPLHPHDRRAPQIRGCHVPSSRDGYRACPPVFLPIVPSPVSGNPPPDLAPACSLPCAPTKRACGSPASGCPADSACVPAQSVRIAADGRFPLHIAAMPQDLCTVL